MNERGLNIDIKRLMTAMIMTLICYITAHGYRLFNALFSGDALLMLHQNDYAWQISLGRFFQPLWLFVRGSLTPPWLITALGMCWLGLSVYLVTDLLGIRRPLYIFLTAAVMCVNPVVTTINASFLPWADLFPFAAFLSILSVWLFEKPSVLLRILGAAALIMSLGTYQAYLCVAITLVMILFMEQPGGKETVRFVLCHGLFFAASGAVYYVFWKISQQVFDVWTSNGYNGMSSLGDYSGVSPLGLLISTYTCVFSWFRDPKVFVSLSFHQHSLDIVWVWILRLIHLVLAGLLVWLLVRRELVRKTSVAHRILTACTVLLLPLGMNVVFLISKGMVHDLMEYAFLFAYILIFHLLEENAAPENGPDRKEAEESSPGGHRDALIPGWCGKAVLLAMIPILWTAMVFAGQVYLKRHLQEEAALSLMTRIEADLEAFPAYVNGEIPVAFAGSFNHSPLIAVPEEFESLNPWGMTVTPMVYVGTEAAMLKYYLGAPADVLNVDASAPGIADMPVYPAEGSIAVRDDTLVIKISE